MSPGQFPVRHCQGRKGRLLLVHEDSRAGAQAKRVVGAGEVGQELPEGVGTD